MNAAPVAGSMSAHAVQSHAAENGATVRFIEQRFNPFENANTWWRHSLAGTLDQFDQHFDEALARVRGQLGARLPIVVAGKERKPAKTFRMVSPADTSLVVGEYSEGTRKDVDDAIAAAKAACPAWRDTPWQQRVGIIERAADLFTKHFYDLSAVMSFEAGKTRFEASIDVDEGIDFLRYYALTMREMGGFDMQMGKPFPNEDCRSMRKPVGVFAVLCPFNFPVAIPTGMTTGALITGNAAILKPSRKGVLAGWWVYKLLREAGVPPGVLHFLTGPDEEVAAELLANADVDGIVFTGSKRIGMQGLAKSVEIGRPRPYIAEMGGKNAVIVTANADLDKAASGVAKSSFGFSGQKCSACSRVYVDKRVAAGFKDRLVTLTKAMHVGHPWEKASFMGPVIEAAKVTLMQDLVAQVKKDGGRVLHGGRPLTNGLAGNYVEPTIVDHLPLDHRVFREEFFMPFVAIAEVASLDEAIAEYNKAEYGLTAGIMSEDMTEVQRFFDHVEAGVVYANRAAGGCTAAVVNGQVFGGWKLSGTTGTGTGRYYLLQFTRERSQTIAT
jgi:1-pyrroline-5-carboxylate dehydrogenase